MGMGVGGSVKNKYNVDDYFCQEVGLIFSCDSLCEGGTRGLAWLDKFYLISSSIPQPSSHVIYYKNLISPWSILAPWGSCATFSCNSILFQICSEKRMSKLIVMNVSLLKFWEALENLRKTLPLLHLSTMQQANYEITHIWLYWVQMLIFNSDPRRRICEAQNLHYQQVK